jgi:hypothetical protein
MAGGKSEKRRRLSMAVARRGVEWRAVRPDVMFGDGRRQE